MSIKQWKCGAPLGELLLGEVLEWHVGVCTIKVLPEESGLHNPPDRLLVLGENDHPIMKTDTERDPDDIDQQLFQAIRAEHEAL